jgi:hypothetical protein
VTTPADEINAAADKWRRTHPDDELAHALADLLDAEARHWAAVYVGQPMSDHAHHALTVARHINQEQQ